MRLMQALEAQLILQRGKEKKQLLQRNFENNLVQFEKKFMSIQEALQILQYNAGIRSMQNLKHQALGNTNNCLMFTVPCLQSWVIMTSTECKVNSQSCKQTLDEYNDAMQKYDQQERVIFEFYYEKLI
eukprot:TRINITY_DN4618_c0_g1_i1.p4 TRINITY_DN4618_c0_g1~~TRINITY_DN4618_c0_g1_i1.p4  ORF type:complete len:128 (-),score=2.12 TRINITY_DN4618_c0_g1_i1:95-478(-)